MSVGARLLGMEHASAVLHRIFTEQTGPLYSPQKGLDRKRSDWRKVCAVNSDRTLVFGAAALAVVAISTACGNSATDEGTAQSPAPVQTSAATPAVAHNQSDMMFARHMIPHHQQAIEMSDQLLAKQGIDPRVLDLAKQIKDAQGPEIEQMQGWLKEWGMPGMPGMSDMPGHMPPDHGGMPGTGTETASPTESSTPGGPMMPGMGDMPGMDGMMSPADMQALQNAQGTEASKLYLNQMIEHHQGAIVMAQKEIENGQFPDAIAMAKSIASSQQAEIDTMNQILKSL